MHRASSYNSPPKTALQTEIDPVSAKYDRRLRTKRKVAAFVIASTVLGPNAPLISDILRLHIPTAQEQTIASALDGAYDTSNTFVRCLSPQERVARNWRPDALAQGAPLTHVVWLRTEDCDILTGLRQRPIDIAKDTIVNSDENAANIKRVRDAVHNAAHEAAHSILNAPGESAAECFGMQTAAAVAVQLGSITANQVSAWRHEEILSREYEHWKDGHQAYYFNVRCRDGESFDLDPVKIEEFPTEP